MPLSYHVVVAIYKYNFSKLCDVYSDPIIPFNESDLSELALETSQTDLYLLKPRRHSEYETARRPLTSVVNPRRSLILHLSKLRDPGSRETGVFEHEKSVRSHVHTRPRARSSL